LTVFYTYLAGYIESIELLFNELLISAPVIDIPHIN